MILGNLTKALFQTGNKVDLGYSSEAICTNSLHMFVLGLVQRKAALCSVIVFNKHAEPTHFEAGHGEQLLPYTHSGGCKELPTSLRHSSFHLMCSGIFSTSVATKTSLALECNRTKSCRSVIWTQMQGELCSCLIGRLAFNSLPFSVSAAQWGRVSMGTVHACKRMELPHQAATCVEGWRVLRCSKERGGCKVECLVKAGWLADMRRLVSTTVILLCESPTPHSPWRSLVATDERDYLCGGDM